MSGYADDVLKSSGVSGTARTPSTDGLFEVRESALPVPEEAQVWFHKHVAMILYLVKRARPECRLAPYGHCTFTVRSVCFRTSLANV
jgi:hypothetical protein